MRRRAPTEAGSLRVRSLRTLPANAPGRPSLFRRLSSWVTSWWSIAAFAASLLLLLAIKAPGRNAVLIEAIELPEDMRKAGYTSSMVTRQFISGLSESVRASEWGQFSSFGRGINLAVGRPDLQFVDASAEKLVSGVLSLSRSLSGRERSIEGEVRKTTSGFELVATGRNGAIESYLSCGIDLVDLDRRLRQCAQRLIEMLAPDVALINTFVKESASCVDGKPCPYAETRKLVVRVLDDSDPANDRWAIVTKAMIDPASDDTRTMLDRLITQDPGFKPARLAFAQNAQGIRDLEKIRLLHDIATEGGGYLLGADVALFVTIYHYALPNLGAHPSYQCLNKDSDAIKAMKATRQRVLASGVPSARAWAGRMEGFIAMAEARNWGAQSALEALLPEFGTDAAIRTELGVTYIYQTTVETEEGPLLQYIDKAIEQYRLAEKISPGSAVVQEHLEAARTLRKIVVAAAKTSSLVRNKTKSCESGPALGLKEAVSGPWYRPVSG